MLAYGNAKNYELYCLYDILSPRLRSDRVFLFVVWITLAFLTFITEFHIHIQEYCAMHICVTYSLRWCWEDCRQFKYAVQYINSWPLKGYCENVLCENYLHCNSSRVIKEEKQSKLLLSRTKQKRKMFYIHHENLTIASRNLIRITKSWFSYLVYIMYNSMPWKEND